MKKFSMLLTTILMSLYLLAQAPQAFKYQAVARNLSGDPIINQVIAVKISILSGSASGTLVYSELHSVTTNSMGLFDLQIGNPGFVLSGNFSEIGWGAATHFLKMEMDENGGFNFQLMGVSQLLSAPYALFAENTANNDDADADPANELQTISKDGQTVTLSNGGGTFNDDVNDADADPANELQTLTQNGLEVSLSQNGGTINIADNDNNPANELQQISKAGNTVTLSQGGGSFTDANTTYTAGIGLQLSGTTFSNTAPDQTVILQATGDAAVSGAYPNFTIHADPANELQALSQNGLEVSLSQGGGTINVADTDNDPVNELQQVTEQDYQVTLSQGGGSFMTGVKSYTQPEIDAMTPYSGLTVHNATTNCINYYYLNNWFETCGTCTPQPSQAAAGPDQSFTDNTLSVHLAANTPERGAGLWTILSGEGGNIEEPGNPATLFIGEHCEDYALLWSISTSCGTTTDSVNISFFATPEQAMAGNDTLVDGGITVFTLQANTPETGQGLWTIVNGEGGSLADANNPNTDFSGVLCNSYDLRWSIATPCDTTTDQVSITFFATPTIAFAGNDTIVTGGALAVTLTANTPEIGEGLWTIINGEGGILDDVTNPQTLFTGLPYVDYTLQWAIATVCDTTNDEVIIAFNPWQCGLAFIDARDGQSYATVQIGDQCWMAENLNIGTRIDGSSSQANNGTIEKYCYSNSEAMCDLYGGLYQWNEMMGYTTTQGVQGICPDGWHLPTDAEWTVLTSYVSSQPEYLCNSNSNYISKALAATTRWNTATGNCNIGNDLAANNATSFTALPGGYRGYAGNFELVQTSCSLSSSSQVGSLSAYGRSLIYNDANVYRGQSDKSNGRSVRCLKDN